MTPSGQKLPTKIGPYSVLDVLGDGGQGVVFLARQHDPIQRLVALKVLHGNAVQDTVMARFQAERQALALMDHPSIAKVFDAGVTEDGSSYFAMEYVVGESITDYCDRHRLPVRKRVQLFIEVCRAVQHAHQRGLIHRDLKPSNILVSEDDGRPLVRIIDFGIARAIDDFDGTRLTRDDQVIGTPAYMSPEQIEGSGDIDTRSDVYALGILLYTLTIGALPFDPSAYRGWTAVATTLHREPPTPAKRWDQLEDSHHEVAAKRSATPSAIRRELRSGDLNAIVSHAIERERSRRYDTVGDLALDLERYLAHQPVRARSAGRAYHARKFVRRHRVGVAFAGTVVIGLAAFAATTLVQSRQIAMEAERATQAAQTSSRVTEVMIDMFSMSDPAQARGNTITAREILDQGTVRVREQLVDEPEVQATLINAMGRVYLGLGLYNVADSLLAEAFAARRELYGEESLEVAETLYQWAHVLGERRQLDSATAFAQQSLEIRAGNLGTDDLEVAASQDLLGRLLSLGGRASEGLELQRQALATSLRKLPENDPTIVEMLGHIAQTAMNAGASLNPADAWLLDSAAIFAERALTAATALYGDRHVEIAAAWAQVSGAYFYQGEWASAENALREALARMRVLYADDHPEIVSAEVNLGIILNTRGEYAEAATVLDSALVTARSVLPPGHAFIRASLINLAHCLVHLHRADEAIPLANEAASMFAEEAPGAPQDPFVRAVVGEALGDLGRDDEALPMLEESLEAFRDIGGPVAPVIRRDIRAALVALHDARGESEEAQRHRRMQLEEDQSQSLSTPPEGE